MNYTLQQAAELVSLAMTIPTLVLGMGVICVWGKAALSAMRRDTLDSHGWFILGVVGSFVGSVLDNLYWSIPWAHALLESQSTYDLMNMGVYFNIFFRQGAGIFAGFCHLKAADMSNTRPTKIANTLLAYSNLLAVGVCIGFSIYIAWKA